MKFAIVAAMALTVTPGPAARADVIDQCRVDTARLVAEQLEFRPGGVEVTPGVVSYLDGGITIEFRPESCPMLPADTCRDERGNSNYLCLWSGPNRESRIVRIGVTNTWINLRELSPRLSRFTSMENLHTNTAKIRKRAGGPTKSFGSGSYDPDTLDGPTPVGRWPLVCVKSAARNSCR